MSDLEDATARIREAYISVEEKREQLVKAQAALKLAEHIAEACMDYWREVHRRVWDSE